MSIGVLTQIKKAEAAIDKKKGRNRLQNKFHKSPDSLELAAH